MQKEEPHLLRPVLVCDHCTVEAIARAFREKTWGGILVRQDRLSYPAFDEAVNQLPPADHPIYNKEAAIDLALDNPPEGISSPFWRRLKNRAKQLRDIAQGCQPGHHRRVEARLMREHNCPPPGMRREEGLFLVEHFRNAEQQDADRGIRILSPNTEVHVPDSIRDDRHLSGLCDAFNITVLETAPGDVFFGDGRAVMWSPPRDKPGLWALFSFSRVL